VVAELAWVSSDAAGLLVDGSLRLVEGLAPSSTHELEGVSLRTLPQPGERLATVATANDVHFGEERCGVIGGVDSGPVFSSPPGAEPYPAMMNRIAAAEMAALGVDAVLIKGDLTNDGTEEEYRAFLDCWEGAFGERLTHVRGNHDSYRGQDYAAWPVQVVDVPGARFVLLDTARPGRTNGWLADAQLEELDELAAHAEVPVVVLGHHPIWDARVEPRTDEVFSMTPDATEALLAVIARRPSIVSYSAGHTHRTGVVEVDGVAMVQVAALKDFPGAWCEYQVFEGGILQVVRRVMAPEGVAWAELTRGMYEGSYGDYAYGEIGERCRLLSRPA